MLLHLTFDHRALKDEAKKRGYEEQDFTEWINCEVAGYERRKAYPVEPWAVSDIFRFVYCNEVLKVELALIEGYRLILYHDCEAYPVCPVKVPIKSIQSRDDSPRLLVEKSC